MGNPNQTDMSGLTIIADAIQTKAGVPLNVLVQVHPTPSTVTATTGVFPAAAGTQLFANTATPTVVELLGAIVNVRADLAALQTKLIAAKVLS